MIETIYDRDQRLGVKAIVTYNGSDANTCMLHLDDNFGKNKRKVKFLKGEAVLAVPAHWVGTAENPIQVFRVYNTKGEMDYFSHKDLFIQNLDDLFEKFPNSGYNNDRTLFDDYMQQNNINL